MYKETILKYVSHEGEYWAGKAHESSDNRGKALRRDGFERAQERYGTFKYAVSPRFGANYAIAEYKPILEEVERILAEAGLDEEEMRKGAAAGPTNQAGQSRNRR